MRVPGAHEYKDPRIVVRPFMLIADDEILQTALEWHAQNGKVAIATVVETWGSAPRPVGSQLVVGGDSRFVGSVSGGCIEADIVTEALDVIAVVSRSFANSALAMKQRGAPGCRAAAA